MTAEDLIKSGDLKGALAALQDVVRSDPSSAKHRIFLFQLLCVLGDWKRAITQLKLCAELDPAAIPMAQAYREAIICEVYREKVFAGEKEPLVFGEPQEWVAWSMEAQKLLATGNPDGAEALRNKALDAAPASVGMINGEAFEWIADADSRLGPLLEMVINGKYYWVPFTAIREVTAEGPEDLRDAVWTPVQLVLQNGGDLVALIPTRYAGTLESEDPKAMLSRATEWTDAGGNAFTGTGQRLLTTDQADYALMDVRTLSFAENG